jgi:hypothetical protein
MLHQSWEAERHQHPKTYLGYTAGDWMFIASTLAGLMALCVFTNWDKVFGLR